MATASDIINYGKTRTPKEIIDEIGGPSLVNQPMEFGIEGSPQIVPEASFYQDPTQTEDALTSGIKSVMPDVTMEAPRSVADYMQQIAPEYPALTPPSAYTPEQMPVEKATVKGALIESLKNFIPGYRGMKRHQEADEIANFGAVNAAKRTQYEQEQQDYRNQTTLQATELWRRAQAAKWHELDKLAFQRSQIDLGWKGQQMKYKYDAMDAVKQKYAVELKTKDTHFETYWRPMLERQGKTPEQIAEVQMAILTPEGVRALHAQDDMDRWNAWEEIAAKKGWGLSEQNFKQAFHMLPSSAGGGRSANAISDAQVDSIVEGMYNRTIPPVLQRLYGASARVLARMHDLHPDFDMSSAQNEWSGAQAFTRSLNSNPILRLRSAVQTTKLIIPTVRALIDQWKKAGGLTRFPTLNRGTLILSKQAGGELGQAASQLEGAIADLQGEYAVVLMGGYAPTKVVQDLAEKNIQAYWDEGMMQGNLTQMEAIADMREQSPQNLEPFSATGKQENYWNKGGAGGAAQRTPQKQATPKGATVVGTGVQGDPIILMKAPDGSLKKVLTSRIEEAKTKYKYTMPTPEDIRGANAAKAK